jgi:hypothetical protein
VNCCGVGCKPADHGRCACHVCLVDDVLRVQSVELGCGHVLCEGCVKRCVRLSLRDIEHMPPRCCEGGEISIALMKRLFTSHFMGRWNERYIEHCRKGKVSCPRTGCAAWTKSRGRDVVSCRECGERICCQCRGRWHGRAGCPEDEGLKALLAVGASQGWRRCYKCRAVVERKDGCYHMTW